VKAAGIEVVGRFASPVAAVDRIAERGVDLVITEVEFGMQEPNGTFLLRKVRATAAEVRIVVLSAAATSAAADAALAAGADAFIEKTARPEDVLAVIGQVLAASSVEGSDASAAATALRRSEGALRLEDRIESLAAEGYSTAEVARMLWLSEDLVASRLHELAASRTSADGQTTRVFAA